KASSRLSKYHIADFDNGPTVCSFFKTRAGTLRSNGILGFKLGRFRIAIFQSTLGNPDPTLFWLTAHV
ncbi:hypothetical protein BJ878DRAFT_387511, partial [Calycina marina]